MQKLSKPGSCQEEVEQATGLTMQRMSCTSSNTDLPENYSSATSRTSDISLKHGVSRQQHVLPPLADHLDLSTVGCLNFPGKDVLEHALEEYSQRVSDLQRQIRETYDLHDQQKSHYRQSIIQLQTKLHESQIEKNALEDFRKTESSKQSELMGQLQEALQEQQKVRQKLTEAEDRGEAFRIQAETMEQVLQDMFIRLSQYEKRSGKSIYFCCDGTFSSSKLLLGPAIDKALQDLENESCVRQDKLQLLEKQLESHNSKAAERTESLLKEQKEKMEQLITNHFQEVAALTENLSHSQSNAASLQLQVEILHEQVKSQTSLHQSQISSLESALSVLRSELKEKQCQYEAKEQSSREAKCLQDLLDQQEGALQLQQQETQQAQRQLEEVQTRMQELSAEMEVLQVKVLDEEKNTELLNKTLGPLQQERNRLVEQLQDLRQDNQQLKAALQDAEVSLSAVEKGKIQQQAVLSARNCSFHQLTLEKQQVTAELEEQRMELVELKEEQEALRELHNKKTEELQAQSNKLKAQLNNTQTSLKQAKSTIRALEGADGNGLKVALGMQKQITAKREQIDFLQSCVQMLEETTQKLSQEKCYQAKEIKQYVLELRIEKDSRKQLETELETMRTNERHLKSKAESLDTALHKMSDSFAECQEFIQKQEQEIMRMKLQHALELKELQGQNLRATGNIHRSAPSSPTVSEKLPTFQRPTTFQTNSTQQIKVNIDSQSVSPTTELRSLEKELHNMINKEQANDISRNNRTRTRNEQGPLQNTGLGKLDMNGAFSTANKEQRQKDTLWLYRYSSCVALGRRSPVHSLLTSDLPTDLLDDLKAESPAIALQISANNTNTVTEQPCKQLKSKLDNLGNLVEDLQIKNQEMASMIKSQEKRTSRVKDRREPTNR